MPTPDEVGQPWPDDPYGAVISPSGWRSYDARTAGALAGGRTPRWARSLANTKVTAERGRVVGRRGADLVFLDANELESLGGEQGWWPPTQPLPRSPTSPAEVAAMSREVDSLKSRVEELERLEPELRATIQRLTVENDGHLATIRAMRQTPAE